MARGKADGALTSERARESERKRDGKRNAAKRSKVFAKLCARMRDTVRPVDSRHADLPLISREFIQILVGKEKKSYRGDASRCSYKRVLFNSL